MKKITTLWVSLLLAGTLGCALITNRSAPTEENTFPTPDGDVNTIPTGAETEIPINRNTLEVPTENDIARDGILQQLSWGPSGGPGDPQPCGDCEVYINQSTSRISLSKFRPGQRLEVIVYRFMNSAQCSMYVADYVTTWSVQVDENGVFSVPVSGPTSGLYIARIIDQDTGEDAWSVNYRHEECPTLIP